MTAGLPCLSCSKETTVKCVEELTGFSFLQSQSGNQIVVVWFRALSPAGSYRRFEQPTASIFREESYNLNFYPR